MCCPVSHRWKSSGCRKGFEDRAGAGGLHQQEGATRYGGLLQIEKRLKEIDDFPKVRLVALC